MPSGADVPAGSAEAEAKLLANGTRPLPTIDLDGQKSAPAPDSANASSVETAEVPTPVGIAGKESFAAKRQLVETLGVDTSAHEELPDTKELPGMARPPIRRSAQTRPLPALTGSSVDDYRTFILQRNLRLRQLLAVPMTADAPAVTSPTKVTLIIRGMQERFLIPAQQVILMGRADFRSGGFQPDIDLTRYGGQERGVSRAHARLHVFNHRLYITDLYSANGTYVGEERLEPEIPREIKNGDEVLLGALGVRFEFE